MTVLASAIISKARSLTLDYAGVRWNDAECVGWLNDGQVAIVTNKPTANTVNGAIPLSSGVRHTLPSGGIALLDITHNTSSGLSCTLVQRADLERASPSWASVSTTVDAEHYMVDEDDPDTFLSYPPNNGSGELQGRYSAYPTAMADEDAAIALADEYEPILLHYLMYRVWTKHTNVPNNVLRGQQELEQFFRALGIKIQSQLFYSPKRNLEEDRTSGPASV